MDYLAQTFNIEITRDYASKSALNLFNDLFDTFIRNYYNSGETEMWNFLDVFNKCLVPYLSRRAYNEYMDVIYNNVLGIFVIAISKDDLEAGERLLLNTRITSICKPIHLEAKHFSSIGFTAVEYERKNFLDLFDKYGLLRTRDARNLIEYAYKIKKPKIAKHILFLKPKLRDRYTPGKTLDRQYTTQDIKYLIRFEPVRANLLLRSACKTPEMLKMQSCGIVEVLLVVLWYNKEALFVFLVQRLELSERERKMLIKKIKDLSTEVSYKTLQSLCNSSDRWISSTLVEAFVTAGNVSTSY